MVISIKQVRGLYVQVSESISGDSDKPRIFKMGVKICDLKKGYPFIASEGCEVKLTSIRMNLMSNHI